MSVLKGERVMRVLFALGGAALAAALHGPASAATMPSKAEMDALAAAYAAIRDGRYEAARDAYGRMRSADGMTREVQSAARFGTLVAAVEESARGAGGLHGQGLKISLRGVERARARDGLPGAHVSHTIGLAKALIDDPRDDGRVELEEAEAREPELARLDARRPAPAIEPVPQPALAPRPDRTAGPDTVPQAPPPERSVQVTNIAPQRNWTTRTVNLRSRPWVASNTLLTSLPPRTEVTVIGLVANSDWQQVRYNGTTAYISGSFLSATYPPAPRRAPSAGAARPSEAGLAGIGAVVPVPREEEVDDGIDDDFTPFGHGDRGGGGGGGGGGGR